MPWERIGIKLTVFWYQEKFSHGKYSDSFNGQKYIDPRSKSYAGVVKKFEEYPKFDARGTYLVDPFGFLMMKYKFDANPMGTIKDIERLIKNQK